MQQPYQYCFGEAFVKRTKVPLGLFGRPYHYLNCFIDDNRILWFVEPQNNKFWIARSPEDNIEEVLHVRL